MPETALLQFLQPSRRYRDKLAAGHCTIGIGAAIGIPGHDRLAVGCVYAKGVPALGPPSLADATSLQHSMPQAALRQRMTDAQPRPTGADDGGIENVHSARHTFPTDCHPIVL